MIFVDSAYPASNPFFEKIGLVFSVNAFHAMLPWHVSIPNENPEYWNGFLLLIKGYNGNIERYEISMNEARDIWKQLKKETK